MKHIRNNFFRFPVNIGMYQGNIIVTSYNISQSRQTFFNTLNGNRFGILLRNVVAEGEATVSNAIEALQSNGFINYFGLQRFGSGDTGTHNVGKELLLGKWREAVELLMKDKNTGLCLGAVLRGRRCS